MQTTERTLSTGKTVKIRELTHQQYSSLKRQAIGKLGASLSQVMEDASNMGTKVNDLSTIGPMLATALGDVASVIDDMTPELLSAIVFDYEGPLNVRETIEVRNLAVDFADIAGLIELEKNFLTSLAKRFPAVGAWLENLTDSQNSEAA